MKALHPLSAAAADLLAASAQSVLQTRLLEPLQKKEANRSRFSRAVLPPSARRIRILDDTAQTDRVGRHFLAFAVDDSRLQNAIRGCVYPETGDVMVKFGEVYYTASVLLGGTSATAPADVCRPQ